MVRNANCPTDQQDFGCFHRPMFSPRENSPIWGESQDDVWPLPPTSLPITGEGSKYTGIFNKSAQNIFNKSATDPKLWHKAYLQRKDGFEEYISLLAPQVSQTHARTHVGAHDPLTFEQGRATCEFGRGARFTEPGSQHRGDALPPHLSQRKSGTRDKQAPDLKGASIYHICTLLSSYSGLCLSSLLLGCLLIMLIMMNMLIQTHQCSGFQPCF